MAADAEFWIPLVDEPIGTIVAEVQREHPEVAELVASPRRLLAFRTFAYIRVGILLGRLLVDHEVGDGNWVETLLLDLRHRQAVEDEVLAVAREVAADAALDDDPGGPSDEERERVADALRRRLAPDA